jgi:hypothetical protein
MMRDCRDGRAAAPEALTRRGLLGAGGALALAPVGPRPADTAVFSWRRAGQAGGVDLTAPAALGPALRAVGARPGPATRTDAEVVHIDLPTPDLVCVSAPGACPGWTLRVHRPPGEPDDWAAVASTALLLTVAPTSCWMGLGVRELAGAASGPVWASTLRVPALLPPVGAWYGPLRRRAVRPADATAALVQLREDRMARPFVEAQGALGTQLDAHARTLLTVCSEWRGPDELQVVLLRPRGADGLREPGA